ncbi:uncharacterized protein LOC129001756 [Macrosteles quadrilineatus]|uniref:uncharacterized protein LOC129001756 n=1 Tax=Macrosteles quadrilineatus TaxID=74068 RepID=UPI0023E096C0|nr:uncharacterized protein LOC129001756 [Macrosteles quadrilineatus]
MGAQGDETEPVVFRIAEQTNRLLEARRKKENARKMARLMKNFNYDLLRGGDEIESEVQKTRAEDVEVDDAEAERLRKLREVEEEIAAGAVVRESAQPNKYESPLVTQLRSVETVDEMYNLADKIIPLVSIRG